MQKNVFIFYSDCKRDSDVADTRLFEPRRLLLEKTEGDFYWRSNINKRKAVGFIQAPAM